MKFRKGKNGSLVGDDGKYRVDRIPDKCGSFVWFSLVRNPWADTYESWSSIGAFDNPDDAKNACVKHSNH